MGQPATSFRGHASVIVDQEEDQGSRLSCHIGRIEALYEDNQQNPDHLRLHSCITNGGNGHGTITMYDIQLSSNFLLAYGSAIERGRAHFSLPEHYLDFSKRLISIPEDDDLSDIHPIDPLRELQDQSIESLMGTKRLLAIRVRAPDGDPIETVEEIEAAIFGTTTNPALIPVSSVVGQYEAVSHGKLLLVKANGTGIVNGVAEIVLSQAVKGAVIQSDLSAHILNVTTQMLGPLDELADRIIYCIPTGSLLQGRDSWTAYTYLYQHFSFFQQSRCTKLSVAVHELGHTFGFRHSGANNDEYGDETDYMGYATNAYGVPRKAFNAHKHWLSGWFADRSVRLDPASQGPIGAHLASFVDYSNPALSPNAVILIQVGDIYIQFSEGKGYNVDTPIAARDRVIITKAVDSGGVSQLLGGVAVGEYFAYPGYSAKYDLIIEVCDRVVSPFGYAVVSIHLADGIQSSVCKDPKAFGVLNGGQNNASTGGAPVDAGALVFEDQNSEKQRDNVIVGVVWGVVGVLVLLSIFLVYRLKLQKKAVRDVSNKSKGQLQQSPTTESFASEETVIPGC